MIKNYFTIAWRNIRNRKFYSLLNILGISLSTAAFLLIIHFVRFERSYEDFHRQADNIFRVTMDYYKGGEFVVSDAETAPPLAPLMKAEMPEVRDYVRVQNMEEIQEVSYQHTGFRMEKVYAVDPSIFSIFSFQLLQGDPAKALNAPLQAVVTESTARRIFGATQAVGKVIQAGGNTLTITGVMKDVPPNTHLKIEMLLSFASIKSWGYSTDHWGSCNNYTYVLTAPGTRLSAFNAKLRQLLKERMKEDRAIAAPVKDIHLYSRKTYEPEVNGDAKTVQFLLAIAWLILLVGAVNYVNLTTARASERAKEVGMRKILGSSRWLLVKQFLVETLLINLMAFALSLLLVWMALPAYTALTGRPLGAELFLAPAFWVIALLLFLLNCLLSGVYPSLVLSGMQPGHVAVRTFTGPAKGGLLRKALVVSQLAAALVVISASLIIYRQLSYLRHYDLGMNMEKVLVLRAPSTANPDSLWQQQEQAFRNSLLQLPQVKKVSAAGAMPGMSYHEFASLGGIMQYGTEIGRGYSYYIYTIDADFLPLMEIKLLAGRNFSPGQPNKDEVIISKDAARLLGYSAPEAAIGKRITYRRGDSEFSTIIGVVDDYHQQSLKDPLLPMIHPYSPGAAYYALKLHTTDISGAIAAIEKRWKAQYPAHPFDYHFLDDLFDQQYKADLKFGRIVGVFSLFTLFITCLGILGLTAYSVSRRSKEIGIRKVLGASVTSIVAMLSGDFVRLVLAAVIIATPLAWYVMDRWLQGFAYHITLQWWMFALAGLVALVVAMLTVSVQSVKAALMNPVKSLRAE